MYKVVNVLMDRQLASPPEVMGRWAPQSVRFFCPAPDATWRMDMASSLVGYDDEDEYRHEDARAETGKDDEDEGGIGLLLRYGDDETDEKSPRTQAKQQSPNVLMAVENIAEDAPMSPKIQSPPSSPSSPSREEPSVEVIEQVAQQPSVDLSKLPPQIVGAIKELYERDYASWGALFPETDYICDPELQARIANFHKMKLSGRSLNRELRKSKAFRNPDILDKLVKRSGLKELGSNYPSHLFDPYAIPETDYYDSIAKQQEEYHKAQEAQKTNTRRGAIDFVNSSKLLSGSGLTRSASNTSSVSGGRTTASISRPDTSRVSKWDQSGGAETKRQKTGDR